MRKKIDAFLRHRSDGSIYLQKDNSLRSVFGEAIAILLFTLMALLLIALAIFVPSGIARAQLSNNAVAGSPAIATKETTGAIIEGGTPRAAIDLHAPDAGLRESGNVPSLWPINGKLTDGFGERDNPFGGTSSEFHEGQDIAAPKGTPIAVTADGTVIFAGWMRGYGQVVAVSHGDNIATRYGHLSEIEVSVGQTLRRGEQLGCVGSTGRSTGSHLHYEVRVDDRPVNPLEYLPARVEQSMRLVSDDQNP